MPMPLTWYGMVMNDGKCAMGYATPSSVRRLAHDEGAAAVLKVTFKSQVAMRAFFDRESR